MTFVVGAPDMRTGRNNHATPWIGGSRSEPVVSHGELPSGDRLVVQRGGSERGVVVVKHGGPERSVVIDYHRGWQWRWNGSNLAGGEPWKCNKG